MAKINRSKFFNVWHEVATLNHKISQGEVCTFLSGLHELQCLYHCDEAAAGHLCFNAQEANQLDSVIMPKMRQASLPDYGNDIHEVCLALINHKKEWIYPKWGFSFEDDDDPNLYQGYRQTGTWNGWQKPLLPKASFLKFLEDSTHGNNDADYYCNSDDETAVITLRTCTARVTLLSEGADKYEETVYRPRMIQTTQSPVWVYEPDGYCFEEGDCLEPNHIDWKGYR